MVELTYRFHVETCEHLERILTAASAHQTARGALLLTPDPDAAVAAARDVGRVRQTPTYLLSMAIRRHARPGSASFDVVGGAAADPVDVLRAGSDINEPALIVFQD